MRSGTPLLLLALSAVAAGLARAEPVPVFFNLYIDYQVCFPTRMDCPLADTEDLYSFDLNGDGAADFVVRLVNDGEGGVEYILNPVPGGGVEGPVAPGATISGPISGAAVPLTQRWSPNVSSDRTGDLACTGCEGLYSVRFSIGAASHYAWVRMIGQDSGVVAMDGVFQSIPGAPVVAGTLSHGCGTANFDGDSDTGTDADIEAFFACLAGACCATCFPGGADFNGDGDTGTDTDIEAFFRVLAGGAC
jgi:hypothetical protein